MKYKLLLFLIITPLLFVDAATITNRGIGSASFFTRGVQPYLSAPDNNVYDLGSTFTVEAWVIPTSDVAGNITAKFAGAAGQRCWRIKYTGTSVDFIASAVCDNPVTTVSASIILPLGRCSHIAVTQNLTDTFIYVNGNLAGPPSSSLGPVPGNGTNAYVIGATDAGGEPFSGIVDEVRIWSVARTQAQIKEFMNRELNGNETGLTGYFTLNRSNFLLSSLPGVATDLTNNNSVPSLSQSCLNQGGGVSAF